MKRFASIVAAAILGLTGTAGHAAVIVSNIAFVASDFRAVDTPDLPAVDPVIGDFTVIFDNSADIGHTTNGLIINAFNLPYKATYTYNAFSDSLTIATAAAPNGCSSPANSFCLFVKDVTAGGTLVPYYFSQRNTGQGFYSAQTITAIVPEPGTWALMVAGFGVVGAALRRRSSTQRPGLTVRYS